MTRRNKKVMRLITRVYTPKEGWDLITALMNTGIEGVQNDSPRYNDVVFEYCIKDCKCWVGTTGYSLVIMNTHCKKYRKTFKEVSISKLMEKTGGKYIRNTKLPKGITKYANKAIS